MKFKIKDRLVLPFNETGTIVKIVTNRLDWFPYKVRIRKGIFNRTNQIIDFNESQLKLEEVK